MASTSFNKTQRKSSKDTPTNKSIWFAKDYDHEDSKFGEIILEEDKEGHDQEHDKLSVEDQQIEENNGRKPRVTKNLGWANYCRILTSCRVGGSACYNGRIVASLEAQMEKMDPNLNSIYEKEIVFIR
ncbi:hypothetical protein Tco_1045890 [Tanacetum coccineum]